MAIPAPSGICRKSIETRPRFQREAVDVPSEPIEVNRDGDWRQSRSNTINRDQTQSLNLAFDPTDSPKFINEVHQTAWRLGIKTLYYLRTDSVINGDIGSRTSTDCLSCDG